MLRRLSLTAFVCGVALVLTACGPSDSPDSAPAGGGSGAAGAAETTAATPPEDLCALLKVDEVAEALGGPGELRTAPGGDCSFFAEAREGSGALFSAVALDEGNGGIAGARSGSETVLKATATDLDGVGEGGYVVAGDGAGSFPAAAAATSSKGLVLSVNVASGSVPIDTVTTQASTLLKLLVAAV